MRDLRDLKGYVINGEEIHPGRWAAYATDISLVVSFAFRHAHGVQHFEILEKGKRNKPDITYGFAVTDVEFWEDYIVLFGIAKDKVTKSEKEYLLFFFLDTMSFYKSDIQIRKLKNEVFINFSEIEVRRMCTMLRYAYKFLKKADEVRLCKVTESLTGTSILKPGKNMFELLFLEKNKDNNSIKRNLCIDNAIKGAFHRYVQTSLGNAHLGLRVNDGHGDFLMTIEEIRPCEDKSGLQCRGLRDYGQTPWINYWLNVEYDYKKDQLYVFDKNWERELGLRLAFLRFKFRLRFASLRLEFGGGAAFLCVEQSGCLVAGGCERGFVSLCGGFRLRLRRPFRPILREFCQVTFPY